MNRKAVAFGAIGAGLFALVVLGRPFGEPRPGVAPIDEPEASAPGRGARPPVQAETPGAPTTSAHPIDSTTPTHAEAAGEPVVDGPAIRGTVVDAVTGEPIAGATVEVRLPRPGAGPTTRPRGRSGEAAEGRIPGAGGRTTTSPTGRFAIAWAAEAPGADVRVSAPGHLDEVRSSVAAEVDLKIALRPGAPIRGRVRRSDGVGVEAAVVKAVTTLRGNDPKRREALESAAPSDGGGAFEVFGLPGEAARIVVEHPDYMPSSVQATPESASLDIPLMAAFRASFRIRIADGGGLAAPVVQWTRTSASGKPMQMGVEDLGLVPADAAYSAANDVWGPVRVPSEPADGTVRFVVTASGRLPWTSDEIAVPAGGAARTIDLALVRDPEAGSLTVSLLDPEGRALPLPDDDVLLSARRTDGPSRPGRPGGADGALTFDGLPAGTYDVFATARRFGASTVTATVEGGRETRVELRLSPPSSLRVRIDAGTRRRVQFQLLRDGAAVPAFEDPESGTPATPVASDRGHVHFLAGPDGTLLRGLCAGRYAVRIVSPDLVAADSPVEVAPGATAELEIHARPR